MTSPSPSVSATLQNVYYERKTGTAKACYICRRPTQTVLATLRTEDFLYICENHLLDTGFATAIVPTPPTGPSPEEIRKVVAEFNAREARKADKTDKDKDLKDKDGKGSKDEEDKDKGSIPPVSPSASASPATASISTSSSAPAQTHRKFALHRSIFDNRKAELRRREQTVRAKEVSKGMPQVPRGSF